MENFDSKKLSYVSSSSDAYEGLINQDWRNQENMLEGILLYPRAPNEEVDMDMLQGEIMDFIESSGSYGHGSVDLDARVHEEYYSFAYQITGFYNHFNLDEDSDFVPDEDSDNGDDEDEDEDQ